MLKIALIDDKSYWIPQIIYSIPKDLEYKFYYYDSIKNIEDIEFDIVFLDYYLDKDNKTALDIIDRFLWTTIVWFSSVDSKNELIIQNWWTYKARKLDKTNINKELEDLFREIFK